MRDPLLRAANLSKSFGGLVAIDRVNLDVFASEVHAVIGPNGAGKTTLLSILAGELNPTGGSILLGERNVTTDTVQARTRMGIGRTFQRSAIIPHFSALDMVRLAALSQSRDGLFKPLAKNETVTTRARSALARVGMSSREHVVSDELSHGEKRRLEIAAVLALCPKILLLDEPLAGLGADESSDVVLLIEGLRSDCAIMLIEHDIDVVFSLADRITVLDNGRVIACGAPAEIRANEAVQRAYLGISEQ